MGQGCYSFVLLLKGAEHLLLIRTEHLVLGSVPDGRFIVSLYGSSMHLCKMGTIFFIPNPAS